MTAPMTRRGLVGRAVAAGAGAALAGVPAVLASPVRPAGDPDPVVALIAEEARLREAGCALRDRADKMLFALPEAERRRIDRDDAAPPAEIAELYRQVAVHEAPADALFDRIVETRATTLAGAIAQLELLVINPVDHVAIVLAGLRDIQAREDLA